MVSWKKADNTGVKRQKSSKSGSHMYKEEKGSSRQLRSNAESELRSWMRGMPKGDDFACKTFEI